MILAECIIHCCPKLKYEKYIRFLIGIMLIMMLVMPFLSFLNAIEEMSFGEFYENMRYQLERQTYREE